MVALKPIKSQMIHSLAYEPVSQTLALRFNRGDGPADLVHQYQGVPPDVAAGLEAAESAGRYFNSNIRGKFGVTSSAAEDEAAAPEQGQ